MKRNHITLYGACGHRDKFTGLVHFQFGVCCLRVVYIQMKIQCGRRVWQTARNRMQEAVPAAMAAAAPREAMSGPPAVRLKYVLRMSILYPRHAAQPTARDC